MKSILIVLALWAGLSHASTLEENIVAAEKACSSVLGSEAWGKCFFDAVIPDAKLTVGRSGAVHARLINGTPVDPTDKRWFPVVNIKTGNSGCTATVIGPRVLITAAHCGRTGATAVFSYDGVQYSAELTRSSIYPGNDHDIALGILNKDFAGDPASVFEGALVVNDEVTLLGYGCTRPGGGGGNDGVLRIGTTKVTRLPRNGSYDVISKSSDGAALCYGDSGGPGFIEDKDGNWVVWGINSKGNIRDTNYNAYLRHDESVKFLEGYAAAKGVDICGVTKECVSGPGPITFTLENEAAKLEVEDLGYHEPGYVRRALEQAMLYLKQKAEIPPIRLPHQILPNEGE